MSMYEVHIESYKVDTPMIGHGIDPISIYGNINFVPRKLSTCTTAEVLQVQQVQRVQQHL